MTGDKKYHTVEDAAKLMGISQARLYQYLLRGKFPNSFKHNGTQWRVSVKDIERFNRGALDVSGAFVSYGVKV